MLIILSALSYQVMAQAEQAELSEQAEQAEQTDSLDLIQLEEVIVSGTRAGKNTPPVSYSNISHSEIKKNKMLHAIFPPYFKPHLRLYLLPKTALV